MRNLFAATTALLLLAACGGSTTELATPEPAPPPPAMPAPPPPAPVAEPAKAPEPTAEEKKKADDLRELQKDRAKMEAEAKTEAARWTPELHAEAKALAEKGYPSARAAMQALLAGKHREPGNAERDKYRHPIETLEFFGFKPTMTVFEIGPGEGWWTELLAPATAKSGKLIVNTGDPNGPVDQRGTMYSQRLKMFLDKSPELFGKVQSITVDGKQPKLGLEGTVDLVLLARGLHGMQNGGNLQAWLGEVHKALKPNGVLGIEQHRAAAGADPVESSKKGYLPEKWVIEQIESAGFKLASKSEINANPKDTRDYPEGVWTLPPTLRLGDKDKDKYVAIGESDRMTLKFTKVAAKADKPAAKADAPKADKPKADAPKADKPAAPKK